MKLNWIMVLPLVLSGGFLALATWQLSSDHDALGGGGDRSSFRSGPQGLPAPMLDLTELPGTPLLTHEALIDSSLEDGELIVLNFFASWCPPCRAEHPTLTALAEAGVPLYGINYRDIESAALSFLEELGNPYDLIGADAETRNARNWGIEGMPETFFINADGIVVLHFRGPIIRRSLENQVRPLLAEAGYTLPDLMPQEPLETN